jgi:hypothetical protein
MKVNQMTKFLHVRVEKDEHGNIATEAALKAVEAKFKKLFKGFDVKLIVTGDEIFADEIRFDFLPAIVPNVPDVKAQVLLEDE